MKWLKNIISKVAAWFSSDKARKALETAASLVSLAAPIVESIAALTPNRTDDEVIAAYNKYGVPLTTAINNNTGINNALLNLATSVLRANLPANKAEIATNILNTAVQLAVTATKAK